MQHRASIGLLGLAALAALAACSASNSDSGGGGGAAGAGAGQGGSTAAGGAAGASAGGAAGAATGPCGNVDANGVCDGNSVKYCQTPPPGQMGMQDAPVLKTKACASYEKCSVDAKGVAGCQLSLACIPNDVSCKDAKTVTTCKADGSGVTEMACDAGTTCTQPPGKQAVCLAVQGAATAKDTLEGCVDFEFRSPTKTGPSAIKTDAAWLQFIAVYNGTDYIGSAITGNDGCYKAELTKPATAATTVYLYSLDFDPKSGNPLVGVVHNTDPMIQTLTADKGYWFWSNAGDPGCGLTAAPVTPDTSGAGKHKMAKMTVPETCGSGAIRVFQWIRYGMNRLYNEVPSTMGKPQSTIAVFWEPGEKAACGACFIGKQAGGATVKLPGGAPPDQYDTLIQISGGNDYPTQWSYSVLSHETGHWVMANYSRSPGEGGPHYVAQASIPGLAYSEGWATAFGQDNVTAPDPMNPDPLYIDTQQGTTFWVDISQAAWSMGNLDLPDPNGAIDQKVNENVVSDMIWHLWQPLPAAGDSSPYQKLGSDKIFSAFQSARLTDPSLNRGYAKLDLIDFYDAVVCSKAGTDAQVKGASDPVTYPWSAYNTPVCP